MSGRAKSKGMASFWPLYLGSGTETLDMSNQAI